MAETLEQKATRLLSEGRLQVEKVGGETGVIVAACRGLTSGKTHRLGFDPRAKNGYGEWRCTCDANAKFRRRCSHLRALQLVVVASTRA